jgi:hypothetical protein
VINIRIYSLEIACPYANILGVRGQGFHSTRIFGLALNDTLATIVLAIITSYLLKINLLVSFVAWFAIGEVLHYLFGTHTAFLEMIGMTPKCT